MGCTCKEPGETCMFCTPREPQKDETLREKVLPGAMRVVEAIKRDLAPDLDENDGGQILVWLRDFGIECAGLKSEPREPHAALIAAIQRLRNAAPTDSDRIRCEVWTDDIHLVLEALKGQQRAETAEAEVARLTAENAALKKEVQEAGEALRLLGVRLYNGAITPDDLAAMLKEGR